MTVFIHTMIWVSFPLLQGNFSGWVRNGLMAHQTYFRSQLPSVLLAKCSLIQSTIHLCLLYIHPWDVYIYTHLYISIYIYTHMFYLLSYAYFAIFHISSTTELINHVDPKAARNATCVAQHHIASPSGIDPGGDTQYTTPMWPGGPGVFPGDAGGWNRAPGSKWSSLKSIP